jgi:hypothetical protein
MYPIGAHANRLTHPPGDPNNAHGVHTLRFPFIEGSLHRVGGSEPKKQCLDWPRTLRPEFGSNDDRWLSKVISTLGRHDLYIVRL